VFGIASTSCNLAFRLVVAEVIPHAFCSPTSPIKSVQRLNCAVKDVTTRLTSLSSPPIFVVGAGNARPGNVRERNVRAGNARAADYSVGRRSGGLCSGR
jgi:hypothetical protein